MTRPASFFPGVLVPAAGAGRRFAAGPSDRTKIELDLGGQPVFARAIRALTGHPAVGPCLIGVRPDELAPFTERWRETLEALGARPVAGGLTERWETVSKMLGQLEAACTHVIVHDAARPLTSPELVARVLEAARHHDAVIPALPITGTVKRLAEETGAPPRSGPPVQYVETTVDRRRLVEVQTPQIFERRLLERAYAQIPAGRVDPARITDDAGLVEHLGTPVAVVEGEARNLKITRPDDLTRAQSLGGGISS